MAVIQALAVCNVEGLSAHQQHEKNDADSKDIHCICMRPSDDDLRRNETR